jgi:methylmalonyl-CoA mutase cobalamin-binding subunit
MVDVFTEALRSIGRQVVGTVTMGSGDDAESRIVEGTVTGIYVSAGSVFAEIDTADGMQRVLFSNVRSATS